MSSSNSMLKAANWANLQGRIALVTGGGTGLCACFAANGTKVYITGRREDVLREAVEQNKGLVALPMDVTSKESIANSVKIVEEAEGKLDILVNNAGHTGPASPFLVDKNAPESKNLGQALFDQHQFKEWQDIFALNSVSPFFVTTAFLPLLEKAARAQGDGRTGSVINISSIAGQLRTSLSVILYSSTKAALDHLTTLLATEFALHDIPVRVNGIAPGPFPSQIGGSEEVLSEMLKKPLPGAVNPSPLKRPGRKEEIAAVDLYLSFCWRLVHEWYHYSS
ncbi:short-chain dehydrogenase [Moniliophthora roreri MCA 2997]|uniref:Short-chain dehydrogenase n=2 Tax=Moniliophthora roreri TaxID=221103 RepID=V2WUG9_MONRO|nr:short-chain dehydrogenase [Moniliophthora roreri MCA 2997]KAI3618202.1 short-chain dehydrogenase [Moniliophthora roreri]